MKNTFLVGMLCGVMLAAAFTYLFAIPANNYHWQTEIWEHGGAAWTFDMKKKNARMGWKWIIESNPAAPLQKPVSAPGPETKPRSEHL
jgi:hypothetical protein